MNKNPAPKNLDNVVQEERAEAPDKDTSGLTDEEFNIMFEQGTERPFSSELNDEKRPGTFVTADTGLPVFRSDHKYDSGSGWPSFYQPVSEDAIVLREDNTLLTKRTEVVSADTGAHLGHVFADGPDPTGLRYCINGLALDFIPDEEASQAASE